MNENKTKTILFIVFPEYGAFNPTFELAKRLKDQGNRILYLGFPSFKDHVEKQGFEFLTVRSISSFADIEALYFKFKFKQGSKLFEQFLDEIEELSKKYQVDLGMVFHSVRICAVPLLKREIPVIILHPDYRSLFFDANVPPMTSRLAPKFHWWSRTMITLAWITEFFKQQTPALLISKWIGFHRVFLDRVKKVNVKLKFGIDYPDLNLEGMALGPREFDFIPDKNYTYLGLSVDHSRESKESYPIQSDKRPLIYGSLGTHVALCKYAIPFFKTIIKAMAQRPQYRLLLNIGSWDSSKLEETVPENVELVSWVPQLEVLKHSDLLITHGGFGAVKESIAFKVPILVFPWTHDQPGNASRIRFHGIGREGNLRKATPETLIEMMDDVLTNPDYKKNISNLLESINSYDALQEGVNRINEILKQEAA